MSVLAHVGLYLLAFRGLMCVVGIEPLWTYVERWRDRAPQGEEQETQ